MTGETDSRTATFEIASSRLKDGLRSCHKLMASYRAMLEADVSNDNFAKPADDPAARTDA